MGHIGHPKGVYRRLQQRLDAKVQRAPDSPTLMKILKTLFSPDDAALGAKLPHNFTSLDRLSAHLKIAGAELSDRLGGMARRGLVFDIEHNGVRYFA